MPKPLVMADKIASWIILLSWYSSIIISLNWVAIFFAVSDGTRFPSLSYSFKICKAKNAWSLKSIMPFSSFCSLSRFINSRVNFPIYSTLDFVSHMLSKTWFNVKLNCLVVKSFIAFVASFFIALTCSFFLSLQSFLPDTLVDGIFWSSLCIAL